jgi:Cytidylyltransferase-like
MDDATHQLIEALHHAPYQYVLAVTGGGAQAAALLLNVPGGSRTILEVLVPYHPTALCEFLGSYPEQSCSAETSRDLARRAWERAHSLAPEGLSAGLGCTASLVSDRPKRGDHRFHLSVHTAAGSTTWSLTLNKGNRDREAEEALLDTVLLNALADTVGVPLRLPVPTLPGEIVQVEAHPASPALTRLFRSEVRLVCADPDGRLRADAPLPALLVPGSFNPLHVGHLTLAEAASRRLNVPAAFEISIDNVDKPTLSTEDVCRRLRPFNWRAPVWLTRAPRFLEKARLFPKATFVIGFDTAVRLVAREYYGNREEAMLEALAEIRSLGCRFLVAGRVGKDGTFHTLEHVGVPESCRDLFVGLAEEEFRLDLSSTEIRRHALGGG